MRMKKILIIIAASCLINAFAFSTVFANPILKADRAQLEAWTITPETIDIPPIVLSPTLDEYDGGVVWQLNKSFNLNLTVQDLLNPAVKMHIKKEFGLEITGEDKALAEKKWTNPLLEADGAVLQRWLKKFSCKSAYLEPGQANFNKKTDI